MSAEEQPLSIALKDFQRLIPEMKECLCITDGTIVLANQTAANALGWTLKDLTGQPFRRLLDEKSSNALLEAIDTGQSISSCEAFFKKKDGSSLLAECAVTFLREESGEACIAVTFKPTQAKALSFKHIFESNMFGMVYGDIHNRIFDANLAFLDMIGYPREDFTSRKLGWRELTPEEYILLDEAAIQEIKTYGAFHPFEKQLIRKDGFRVDVLVGGILEEGTPDRIVAFVIDISARKRAERAVLKGEELFRIMADASNIIIWFMSPDLKIHYINRAVSDFIGYSLEQMPDWEHLIHPDDAPVFNAIFKNAFEQRTHFEFTDRALRADGQYRWLYTTGAPVFSTNNEFLGCVGTAIDIHDLKEAQAELERYAQRLEHSNKELERFATIASHNLQEPLRKVMMFSDHLNQRLKGSLNKEALDDLKRIQNAVDRMRRLIEDLLDLSRVIRRGQPFKKIDLRRLTEEAIAALHYSYPDIRNQVEMAGGMTIDADLNQIHQMMVQLLDNALKFHKPGRPSMVKVNIQPLEENQCQISVSDDGIGIKAEHLGRIFDTFVRLHHGKEYPGTGIGLSLVQKIVERHGGSITVESTPGHGSKFKIFLPTIQNQ